MPDDLYIGIDLGTTGVKAGLFDARGRTVATASREIQLETPRPGFTEFDADEYIALAFDAIRELIPGGGDVRAVGLSSQAQTFVVLDAAGRPLRPAVSWLDVRAEAEAEELSRLADRLGRRSINAIASAPKLLWLRRHEPDLVARAHSVCIIPGYLLFRLTGRAATDPITAASTGAYDFWEQRWVPELLDVCGLEPDRMPEVLSPAESAGRLTADAAAKLGLPHGTVAVVGTNDQYAGALGAGNVTPGCASLALGAALALVATSTSRADLEPGEGIAPHPASRGADKPLYALLAYAKTSGVVIRWFRDQFAPDLSYDELFAEAAHVPVGAEGVSCIPHFAGTATPDFNSAVRGAFAGLNLSHTRAHLARALLESLAFTVRENVELLGRTVPIREVRAIGGGARSDVWLQMIADVTGVPVERPETREAACLGAAVLGMVGAGRFESAADAAWNLYRADTRFEPNFTVRDDYDRAFAHYRQLLVSLYGERHEQG
jgi:xylulokinase